MTFRPILLTTLTAALFCAPGCLPPASAVTFGGASTYTITDLGTLGGDNSFAYGINNTGTIVGSAETGTAVHAFSYSTSMTDLGTLPAPYNGFSIAYAINSAGRVAGVSGSSSGIARHPFRTAAGGLITASTDLDAPGGTSGPDDSTALAINASGVVAGFNFPAYVQPLQPFKYVSSYFGVGGVSTGSANGVNDASDAVGYTYYSYGFETRQLAYVSVNGGSVSLIGPSGNTSGGPNSVATAINNSGQVAGYLDYRSSGFGYFNLSHAFLYDTGTAARTDLGTTPYVDTTQALALNNSGVVVGTAFNSLASASTYHAVLFQSGHAYDLNELLAGSGSGAWLVNSATGINDSGKIVGYGIIGGHTHAFLLTPTGTPAQAPAAPSGLTALPVSGTLQVNLAFTDNSGGHALLVLERKTGSGAFGQIAVLAAGSLAYQDGGLTAGTTYTYRIKARTSIGDSAFAVSPPVTTPPAATNVSAQVTVTRSGFRFVKGTASYAQTVTLTNTGAAVAGPISLVLDNLQANLINATAGLTAATSPTGSPYLTVAAGTLAPGAKLVVVLQFTPQTQSGGGDGEGSPVTTITLPITYTTRVLAGAGLR